jgi:hypothetical protein
MYKVIIDRPRRHSPFRDLPKKPKGYEKNVLIEELPQRETLRKKWAWTSGMSEKETTDRLGPLRRFLHQRVGRPWNMVHAEIWATVNRRSPVLSALAAETTLRLFFGEQEDPAKSKERRKKHHDTCESYEALYYSGRAFPTCGSRHRYPLF